MVNYITLKKELKNNILKAVNEAGQVDLSKLIAELCLSTGFKESLIKKILSQMDEVGYIKIDGLVVYKTETKPKEGEEQ